MRYVTPPLSYVIAMAIEFTDCKPKSNYGIHHNSRHDRRRYTRSSLRIREKDDVEPRFMVELSYPTQRDTFAVLEISTFQKLPDEFFKEVFELLEKHTQLTSFKP